MRAIGKEQVDGFPTRDELRTIFVEHEIEEREVGEDKDRFPILNIDLSGIDWVVDACNNVYGCAKPVTRESVAVVMEEIGFGNSDRGTGMATPKLNIWNDVFLLYTNTVLSLSLSLSLSAEERTRRTSYARSF